MTVKDAVSWCEYNLKRRYEWVEIIGRSFGGESAEDKFCQACKAAKRNKDCRSCSKKIEVVKSKGGK